MFASLHISLHHVRVSEVGAIEDMVKRRGNCWITLVIVTSLFLSWTRPRQEETRHEKHANVFLILEKENGRTTLRKNVTEHWRIPVRKWNQSEELIVNIHVLKSGGRSVDSALVHNASLGHCKVRVFKTWDAPGAFQGQRFERLHDLQLQMNKTKKAQLILLADCNSKVFAIFHFHFDWTLVHQIQLKMGYKVAPLIILRDPVQRMVSNFYFVRNKPWTKSFKFSRQNLTEYLEDMDSMMETRVIWNDGQVSYSSEHLVFLSAERSISQRNILSF